VILWHVWAYPFSEVDSITRESMADETKDKPTGLGPIFVGSGIGPDLAAEFSLAILDRLLGEEAIRLPETVEGEISAWIKELVAKPAQLELRRASEHQRGAIQREVMREVAEAFADPRQRDEVQLMAQIGNIDLEDMQSLMVALQQGNVSAFQEVRSKMVEPLIQKLGKQMTSKQWEALLAVGVRCRAGCAAGLCMAVFKVHPLSLIAEARRGNKEAVLRLIKVDKLFLTDSCAANVIRRAELQNDRRFLAQVARSVRYRVRANWRQGCRLYLYALISLGFPMPNLVKLRLRLDPEGTRFRGEYAFEKFLERTRKEFARMCELLKDRFESEA
jgi:hypothetical protein